MQSLLRYPSFEDRLDGKPSHSFCAYFCKCLCLFLVFLVLFWCQKNCLDLVFHCRCGARARRALTFLASHNQPVVKTSGFALIFRHSCPYVLLLLVRLACRCAYHCPVSSPSLSPAFNCPLATPFPIPGPTTRLTVVIQQFAFFCPFLFETRVFANG